jgi:hypothetical protein
MFESCTGAPHVPCAQLTARQTAADTSAQHEQYNFFPFSLNLIVLEGEEDRGDGGDVVSVSNGKAWLL